MGEITTNTIKEYLELARGRDISLDKMRMDLQIDRGSKSWETIRKILHRFATQPLENSTQRLVKPSGRNDGIYTVLTPVEPVRWWEDEQPIDPIEFKFPRSYEDESSFGIEEFAEVFAGDMILISGASNFGKTTLAISIMGENLTLMPANLMGSEYTAANGKMSPKFKRRMGRMKWVDWITEDNQPRFQLLPVGSDYEDYVEMDKLNVIDWISLNGEYYLIDRVMKSIKDRVGKGVAVVVLQKNKSSEFGEGGERTERYADVSLMIDPFGENESLLTIGKVKSPIGKATGRTFAFEIVDYGANLLNIREVRKCRNCWGKGWKSGVICPTCQGKKYVAL